MKSSGKFKSKKDIEHQKNKIKNDIESNRFSDNKEREEMWRDHDALEELEKESSKEKLQKEYYKNMDENSGKSDWDGEKEVQKYADKRGISYEEADKELREGYNKKQQGVQNLKDKLNGNDNKKYSEKQLEMVWENEDATEVYDHLSRGELNKLNQATKDMETTTPGTPGHENAKQYVQEMEDKAATKFLNAHREDPNYEGYFMSDEYVASENKKADIRNQKLDIEDATGTKVKDAFETDLYGGGKEDRFALEDGRMITHTTESFGQEDDTWAVFDKGMQNGKYYKSYDEMMKNLNKSGNSNKAYKNAFEEYKKKHPNTKLTLQKFINMSEGK